MLTREFTRDELQQAYALAFILHPSPEVALRVLDRACDLTIELIQREARRERSVAHYKSRIPHEALLQFAVYCASYERELDQESPLPTKYPKYKPTREDLVVRYLKHLVWNNLLKANYSSLGIGLGCLLYDYRPKQIADLLVLSDELSIRRIKRSINKQLMKRFRYAEVVTPKGNAFRTTSASDSDRELIRQALKAFTPWNTTHIPLAPEQSLLEKLVDDQSNLTNWDWKHALLDPDCGGVDQLVFQHNKLFARYDEDLDDPNLRLFVPDFEWTPPPPVDRFKAPRLTDNDIYYLKERLKLSWSRASDVTGLLLAMYDGEVDETLIRVFDDWASPTNESPPLRGFSHRSSPNGNRIRKPFVEERGNAMASKIRILVIGASPFSSERLYRLHVSEFADAVRAMRRSILDVGVPLINSCSNYEDVWRDRIDVRLNYECLLSRMSSRWGLVCPIDGNAPRNNSPTILDFTKRSISDDLTKPWPNEYPIPNVWEWLHDMKPRKRVPDSLYHWFGLNNPKPKLHVSDSLLIRSFFTGRERGNGYGVFEVYAGHGVSRHNQPLPKFVFPELPNIVFPNANETRSYSPSLNLNLEKQGNPFETRSLIGLKLRTDGHLAVRAFHSLEEEQLKDLKPFVPERGSLTSDIFDWRSAQKIIGELRYSHRMANEVNESVRWSVARVESLFPLWGMNSPANPANRETDAR